jgi:hypothetical protein
MSWTLDIVYAGNLADDLGFRGMTPEFWKWCERHDLRPIHGKPFGFRLHDVQRAIRLIGSR